MAPPQHSVSRGWLAPVGALLLPCLLGALPLQVLCSVSPPLPSFGIGLNVGIDGVLLFSFLIGFACMLGLTGCAWFLCVCFNMYGEIEGYFSLCGFF